MAIFLIFFFVCLIPALIPFIIQMFTCIKTEKLLLRLIPVSVPAVALAIWAFLILDGYFTKSFMIGNAIDWLLWQCMTVALIIAHGPPFLILGWKK